MCDIMSYGKWDFCDGIPVAHYLEPGVRSKRVHFFQGQDVDLFNVQAFAEPASCYNHNHQGKEEKNHRKKKGRMCYASTKKPKAVDEDLYKIPPELLYRTPKRKRMLRNYFSGCLGLNCIA
ncbi:uncharacterized protein A4U43_C04F20410 [Asparagus officinalis]|uniref:Uncharacterized protein n=1 Tax=Asparagus officinalis TaxID=4686 RepID=A0A5P1F300_ASPOF|nr:uncharacterized protein LOC109835999 [Asparagus officinalis]ONK72534.1 uncharacterized protein A4U43_C04F20410 [Asparagus officinalis]